LAVALVLVLAAAGPAGAAPMKSGVYGEMLLAVGADGGVQGYYMDEREGGQFECEMYFAGPKAGAVKAWDFMNTEADGMLAAGPDDGDVTLTVKDFSDFGGCGMAGDPDIDTGDTFEMERATGWTGLEQIAVDRAYLRKAPGEAGAKGPYVIKGDVVGVLGMRAEWVRVEYVSPETSDRSVKGWIEASEAKGLAAP
jgi:hypothetical protein